MRHGYFLNLPADMLIRKSSLLLINLNNVHCGIFAVSLRNRYTRNLNLATQNMLSDVEKD